MRTIVKLCANMLLGLLLLFDVIGMADRCHGRRRAAEHAARRGLGPASSRRIPRSLSSAPFSCVDMVQPRAYGASRFLSIMYLASILLPFAK